MIYTAEVKLWGTTIGAVSLDDSQKTALFEVAYQIIKIKKIMIWLILE